MLCRVLQRLVPFNTKELLYYDYAPLPEQAAKDVNARRVEDLKVGKKYHLSPCSQLTNVCSGLCLSM